MPLRNRFQGLARIARSQATALRNAVRGWPLVYTSPSAMTLDDDDLALAAALLADRVEWASDAPVTAFEREFAEWNGSRAAFAFASGRIALGAAIDALGLRPGDDVVMPGYSCVVVANALRAAGVRPVFADIELETYGLDKDALRRSISGRTKAILIHHLYGFVSRDLDAVLDIARGRGLSVIEDCAQATGAVYDGRNVGNFGDVAIFSGDPSKPFTCIQGGIAVTNDEAIVPRLAAIRRAAPRQDDAAIENRLRNVSLNYALNKDPQRWWKADLVWLRHGNEYFFGIPDREVAGAAPLDAGCRMSGPIARLAANQLRKLDHYNARRRANAARWDMWCDAHGFTKPLTLPRSTPIVLRYPVLVTPDMKRDLRWAYRSLGVVPGTWFVTHLHPAPGRLDGVPNASRAVEQCINLPTLNFEDRWTAVVSSPGA
jgi:dTDP-4-amino-4,6-dideoxygalactose transaminase